MNGINEIFDNLAIRAKQQEGDYYGEDQLLYCGKCGRKKETKIMVPDFQNPDAPRVEKIVPIICECKERELERIKQEEEHREKMLQIEQMRQNSLIESKFKNATLENFRQTKQNEKLWKMTKRYIEEFQAMYEENQGLLLWGPVGTGKSFAAACIANELLARMTTVIMTSFVKILQDIFQTDEAPYLEKLNKAKLLIIDDLGTERNTDYSLEKVYSVIDSRYRVGKPLILTTNLSMREMMEEQDIRYKRIYDRIFEICYPFHVTGESWREQEAARRYDRMRKLMEV